MFVFFWWFCIFIIEDFSIPKIEELDLPRWSPVYWLVSSCKITQVYIFVLRFSIDLFRVTIGTLYPGYQSYKSLKTADLPEIVIFVDRTKSSIRRDSLLVAFSVEIFDIGLFSLYLSPVKRLQTYFSLGKGKTILINWTTPSAFQVSFLLLVQNNLRLLDDFAHWLEISLQAATTSVSQRSRKSWTWFWSFNSSRDLFYLQEIDEMIEQTKQQGYTALASLTNRGVRYASNLLVNSAILVGWTIELIFDTKFWNFFDPFDLGSRIHGESF